MNCIVTDGIFYSLYKEMTVAQAAELFLSTAQSARTNIVTVYPLHRGLAVQIKDGRVESVRQI